MRKYSVILGIIQLITAAGAIPAGYGYLTDLSGQAMGTSPELLKNSPLNNFLLPGLFLLLINGLATLAGSILSFLRHRRAGEAGIVLGALLFLWIVIQVWWIGLSSALQPVFLVVGVAETALGWKIRNEIRKSQER